MIKSPKTPTNEQEKIDLRNEIETYKQQMAYISIERDKLQLQENNLDRWIFEATLKLRAYEKRDVVNVNNNEE